MYDVVVAGGSISGLLCARELARRGHSVVVLEEDTEIGTPDHCGGMTSQAALEELGLESTTHCTIHGARVSSPSGKTFEIGASRRGIIGLDRRELDKQAARQAVGAGAELRLGESLRRTGSGVAVTSTGEINCTILVDARGISSMVRRDRSGAIPSAQCEVHADSIREGWVEVAFDAQKYPGFFAWVIPISHKTGKVGAAGRGINAATALDSFMSSMSTSSALRRIYAPVWVGGPADTFVKENMVAVGDAAGQTKPTTAGGIFSCGYGGVLAGEAISRYIETGKNTELDSYQKRWEARFGAEFARQALARRILERLDNRSIDRLFDLITPEMIDEISQGDDFDFHAGSLVGLLGMRTSMQTAQAILGSEARKLFGRTGASGKI